MSTLYQYCLDHDRQLRAAPPTVLGTETITFRERKPWQQLESPDPAAVILASHLDPHGGFTPNVVATSLEIEPEIEPAVALDYLVASASTLTNWRCSTHSKWADYDPGADYSREFRYIKGTFIDEPGGMVTTSVLAGWNCNGVTKVLQILVTGCQEHENEHDAALDCVVVNAQSVLQIVESVAGQ